MDCKQVKLLQKMLPLEQKSCFFLNPYLAVYGVVTTLSPSMAWAQDFLPGISYTLAKEKVTIDGETEAQGEKGTDWGGVSEL